MKLLRIDSSAREGSVSRQLTAKFGALWKARHPEGEILERDVSSATLPMITGDWVSASRTDPSQRSEQQRKAIACSDFLISELMEADTIVIGTPMHNFGISWPLKAWIDQIVRIGKTVEYGPRGPQGLLRDKQVVVISSRGGSYPPGTPRAHMDFVEPYLRAVLGFIGIQNITFIHADNQYRMDQAVSGKADALEQVARVVAETARDSTVPLAQ